MKEIEVKVVPASHEKVREALQRKGFVKEWEGILETVYYDKDGELKESGRVLRLRRGKGKPLLGYKRTLSDKGVSIYEEHEVEVGEGIEHILLGLGYKPTSVVRKRREVWSKDGVLVMIEELLSHPCVPPYVEVEVREDKADSLPALVESLGLKRENMKAINTHQLIALYCGSNV